LALASGSLSMTNGAFGRSSGLKPVASSVSGTAGCLRRPELSGRMWLMSWQEAGPLVTAVIQSFVARMWPQCGPSGHELGRRVRAVRSRGMLRRWRWSDLPVIVRC
jgi:hypothetical protein